MSLKSSLRFAGLSIISKKYSIHHKCLSVIQNLRNGRNALAIFVVMTNKRTKHPFILVVDTSITEYI